MEASSGQTPSVLKKSFDSKILTIVMVVVALIIAATIYFYLIANENKNPAQPLTSKSNAPVKSSGLGATLYEKTQNPIQGALPKTATPVVNPLNSVYKNPFQ